MSKAEEVPSLSLNKFYEKIPRKKLNFTFEIFFIYLLIVITVIAFYESIKTFFYAVLGYVALSISLIILIYIVVYIIYNFSVIFYELFIRKPS